MTNSNQTQNEESKPKSDFGQTTFGHTSFTHTTLEEEQDPQYQEKCIKAGEMIKKIREDAGMDAAILASIMKVSVQKIKALESGDYKELPNMTFARGLISSICRHLQVDAAPVLEQMPAISAKLQPKYQKIDKPFVREGDESNSIFAFIKSKPMIIGALLLLLAALFIWLLPTKPINIDASIENTQNQMASEALQNLQPQLQEQSQEQLADPSKASSPENAASAAQPAIAPNTSENQANESQTLQLIAKGESWVKVTDVDGKTLISRTIKSGEAVGISGKEPLSVIVGRKEDIQIQVRGKPFEYPAGAATGVARFQVK